MEKYIYNNNNGLWYELQGDYYIPCLVLDAKDTRPIGMWGRKHLRYIKEHRPVLHTTLGYLQSIAAELRDLGFDEVMFTDFRFPDTDQLDYSGNKSEAIQRAADTLVEKCTTETFALSFMASDSTVQAVDGRSRLYLDNVAAASAASTAARYGMEDPATGIVFITDSYDTRYEEYGVLRPITSFVGNG